MLGMAARSGTFGASCRSLAAAAIFSLAPSWLTSTTMLRSSRKLRTSGVPLNTKLTVPASRSLLASMVVSVGGSAESASPRSHWIGWSKLSV